MEVYLIICTGGSDTQIAIVTKETFDWLSFPPPLFEDGYGNDRENIPEKQRELIAEQWENHEDAFVITIGSWDNDRALMAVSDVEGLEGEIFDSHKKAFKAIEKHGLQVVDEYLGMIY